jgi:thiamine-phosphate pyrophosphorylase
MNPATVWPRHGLYLITPDEPDTARLLARVEPLLAAGVAMLQYRNKSADAALRRQQANALLNLCREMDVPLIVNDDWRLAAEIGADGAHLGADDGELRSLRDALGRDFILGASCYNDLARAEHAALEGASYLAFGAFFASGTKPLARRADLSLLHEARRFGLPTVAIGGLSPDNASSVLAAGADLIAVIGAIFDAPDPVVVIRAFQSCFDHPQQPSPSSAEEIQRADLP